MPSNIPACGIEAYMDGEVERLVPGNWWWKLRQKYDENITWIIWFLLAAVVVLSFIFDMWREPRGFKGLPAASTLKDFLDHPLFYAVLCVCGPHVAFLGLTRFLRREPGEWERYSLAEFMDVYDWVIKPVRLEIEIIRKDHPEAEFEIAVLEPTISSDLEYGLILFLLFDDMGSAAYPDGGKPVLIVDGKGHPQQFGEAYAPAVAY